MKNPKITVLMPVYNAEKYLYGAVGGVFKQSFSDFEFVIVNDGSKDRSAEIVRSYSDPRIVFIDNRDNAGVVPRLNQGMEAARGEYIARIDSDDMWIDPDKLRKQVAFLDANPGYGLIGTNADIIDESGKKISSLSYPLGDQEIRSSLLSKDYFINCTMMFRKSAVTETEPYYLDEKYAEDYGLWMRIGRKWKFANLPDVTSAYRINLSGITQSNQLVHTQNSYRAVARNRKFYPGFCRAWLKWNTKLALLRTVGAKRLNAMLLRMKEKKA